MVFPNLIQRGTPICESIHKELTRSELIHVSHETIRFQRNDSLNLPPFLDEKIPNHKEKLKSNSNPIKTLRLKEENTRFNDFALDNNKEQL